MPAIQFRNQEAQYLQWVSSNPSGFVLNARSSAILGLNVLHRSTCSSISDTRNAAGEFTERGYFKIVAGTIEEIREWANTHAQGSFNLCGHCKPLVADGTRWADEEIFDSVAAYLTIQSDLAAVNRQSIYRKLAEKHGRTPAAFEYRMQNISYVLHLIGLEWIPGLPPAKNVGARTAERIEDAWRRVTGLPLNRQAGFREDVAQRRKRARAKARPKGSLSPMRTVTQVSTIVRDASVAAWVLERANGCCECCRKPAPFTGADGFPFLEVHHVRQLALGGEDTPSNAAAVCPNCHRELHFGARASEIRTQLTRFLTEIGA